MHNEINQKLKMIVSAFKIPLSQSAIEYESTRETQPPPIFFQEKQDDFEKALHYNWIIKKYGSVM